MCRSLRFACCLVVLSAGLLLVACGGHEFPTERGTFQMPENAGKSDSLYSCQGNCGAQAPGGCWCDEDCLIHGDCCLDKEEVCDQPTPPPPPPCGMLSEAACVARDDCEWKTEDGFPGPISFCAEKTVPKKCGPILNGQCAQGEVCNITSCGIGSLGECVEQPDASQCFDYMWKLASPVCGCDKNTYGNDCLRLAAGVAKAHDGPCDQPQPLTCNTSSDCPADQYCHFNLGECLLPTFNVLQGECKVMPQACTANYAPVCGCDGNTYSNDCHAAGSGVSVAHDGPCVEPEPAKCHENADCAADQYCHFNPGECLLPTFDVLQGECITMPEVCMTLYAPVCGCDGTTYSNGCYASSSGTSVAHDGPC